VGLIVPEPSSPALAALGLVGSSRSGRQAKSPWSRTEEQTPVE